MRTGIRTVALNAVQLSMSEQQYHCRSNARITQSQSRVEVGYGIGFFSESSPTAVYSRMR